MMPKKCEKRTIKSRACVPLRPRFPNECLVLSPPGWGQATVLAGPLADGPGHNRAGRAYIYLIGENLTEFDGAPRLLEPVPEPKLLRPECTVQMSRSKIQTHFGRQVKIRNCKENSFNLAWKNIFSWNT